MSASRPEDNAEYKDLPWEKIRLRLARDGFMYRLRLGSPSASRRSRESEAISTGFVESASRRKPSNASQKRGSSQDPTTKIHGTKDYHNITNYTLERSPSHGNSVGTQSQLGFGMEFVFQCWASFMASHHQADAPRALFEPFSAATSQDPLFADALIVYALDLQDWFGFEPLIAREEILAQRTRVIHDLRKRISSASDCSSDAVMLTILLLMSVEMLYGRMEALEMHLVAFRQIVDLQGGINSPTLNPYVKDSLVQFKSFMDYRSLSINAPWSTEGLTDFDYARHPFVPGFCARLTELPGGFSVLACTTGLSMQTLNLVESITRISTDKQPQRNLSRTAISYGVLDAVTLDAFRAFDLLRQQKLPMTEQLVVVALLACCVAMNGKVKYHLLGPFLRLQCMALATTALPLIKDDIRDCLTWVAMVLVATGAEESPSSKLAMNLLSGCKRSNDWETHIHICQRYFWTELLTERLLNSASQR